MSPVRVVAVRYLNTSPLIEGLDQLEGLHLDTSAPAGIADAIKENRGDIGLCSIVDAADPALELLPVGMIGCDGPTLTVRLFSTVPFEDVTQLHADSESHTSVVLARLLLARRYNAHPTLQSFVAGSGAWPPAVVLIGDKVVTDHPPEQTYCHQLDLGEAWKAWTGLPFVYAMWMCRAGEGASPRIRTAAAMLERQRLHNRTRLDWIVNRRAADAGWPLDVARHYIGSLLRYSVGDAERTAVSRFFTEARAAGLLPPRDITTPRWA